MGKSPYKMKGSPMERNFGTPFKNDNSAASKMNMNDPKVKANFIANKDNQDYRDAVNTRVNGKFSYDEKTNTSTVTRPVDEESSYTNYAKELDKAAKKGSAATKKKKKAAPVKNYKNGYYGA